MMTTETINGVSFEDWAAACAHLSQGMPTEKVIKILGIEAPIWEETTIKWSERLGELGAENMDIMTEYGHIFANPKVGRFADMNKSNISSVEDVISEKVPDYETYKKIFFQIAAASNYGIDLSALLEKEYDLNLAQWSQVSMYWSNYSREKLGSGATLEEREFFDYDNVLMKKYEAYWDDFYKDHKANLGEDINF